MFMSLEDCIVYATKAHKEQLDKIGKPYILHPLAVMLRCRVSDMKVAVLHDVFEDCYPINAIDALNLSDEEKYALIAITHLDNEPYVDYIGRVKASPMATRVKIQDVEHNNSRMEGLDVATVERMKKKYRIAHEMLIGDELV